MQNMSMKIKIIIIIKKKMLRVIVIIYMKNIITLNPQLIHLVKEYFLKMLSKELMVVGSI